MSEPEEPPRKKQRKIGSRSCDGCKIRKVKCTEIPPCVRCRTIGIECTFLKAQSTRGPRTLRAKTLQQIQEAQQSTSQPSQPSTVPVPGIDNNGHDRYQTPERGSGSGRHERPTISIESLVLRLCIYRLRLFPVWPIIAVEEVIAALHRDSHDVETFALALAVGAATMAQLKLDRFKDHGVNDNCTAESLEVECQRIRVQLNNETAANLNRLRTSFFLHIYHENLGAGGTKSLLYLREAITLAQIMGLDRARMYGMLDPAEDRLRRRILWLLFVTERGVAALHKLPTVLGSADKLPPLNCSDSEDEAHILPAFEKLVHLFWIFDQSGAFAILQDAADDEHMQASTGTERASGSWRQEVLATLQRRLAAAPLDLSSAATDIQKADIWVTRQWMQILIWRATWRGASGNWRASLDSSSSVPDSGPVQIAQEFLSYISRLPSAALEAHGPAIELKVFEIASAVADTLASRSSNFTGSILPTSVLNQLQQILATSRGGNNSLLSLLAARTAHIGLMEISLLPSPSGGYDMNVGFDMTKNTHEVEDITDEDGDREQNWEGHHPATRISPPLSPWLSLVTAAAELEQQQDLGTHSFAGDMSSEQGAEGRGQASLGNGVMDWFGLP